MMKYKLIRKYPGSPELNTIIEGHHYINGNHKPSDYPYFWQKIVLKNINYKILKFKHSGCTNGAIVEMKDAFYIKDNEKLLESNYIKSKSWNIYSVKRLSDGEIFTLGDKVNFQGNGCSGKHIINKFIIKDGYIAVNGGIVEFPLKNIEKLNNYLFVTGDNVSIHEGEWYYYLKLHSWSYDRLLSNRVFYEIDKDNTNSLYFSTETAVKNYIIMNKPCLSLSEISKFYKSIKNGKSKNSKSLIELVKRKINENK